MKNNSLNEINSYTFSHYGKSINEITFDQFKALKHAIYELRRTDNNRPIFKDIIEKTSFLPENTTLAERLFNLHKKYDKSSKHLCKFCGKPTKFNLTRTQYNNYCCKNCRIKDNPQIYRRTNINKNPNWVNIGHFHKTHLQNDPEYRKLYFEKRKNGCDTEESKRIRSEVSKQTNKIQFERKKYLLSTVEIFSKEKTHNLLLSEKYFYKKYFGKGKDKLLLKESPELYRSILVHTEEFKKITKHFNLTARLLIIAELNYDTSKHMCNCGSFLLFDPAKQVINSIGSCSMCARVSGSGISQQMFEELRKSANLSKSDVKYGINQGESVLILTKEEKEFFKKELPEEKVPKSFRLDFIHKNKVIEFDGTYWHKNTEKRDAVRDKILTKRGLIVLHIHEDDYRNSKTDTIEKCVGFLNNQK
jgi:hypothetical protein